MATLYISPTGSGLQDGSSAENAGTLAKLSQFIGQAGPGGEVLLIADQGTYQQSTQISINKGGTEDAPVTIRGVDSNGDPMSADISGSRAVDWHDGDNAGSELFRLLGGANNLTFSDLSISNVGNGAFRVGADVSNLTIEHVDATNVVRFFENYVSGSATTATVSGLTITDVDVTGYTQNAIRIGYDSHDINISDVHADMAGADANLLYVSGVLIQGTAHDVVLNDVSMANNYGHGATNQYWNGDGFTTENGVYNVLFQNTLASGNTDAGYDLKSSNTVLIDAVAEDNSRSFRFWSDSITGENLVSIDPTSQGGNASTSHVWLAQGATVTINGITYSDSGLPATLFDLNQGGATLFLSETVIDPLYATLIKLLGGSIVEVTPPNDAPTAVTAVISALDENAAGGTLVATLTTTDPDTGDSHVYTLSGSSSALFEVIGSEIHVKAGAVLDYETQNQHTVTVTSTDSGGLSVSHDFVISLTDKVEGGNGTAGDDYIAGTTGNDTMKGGLGSDTYLVDSAKDVVTELASQGTDTVHTTLATYQLTANVENLTYTGSGNFTGTGNTQSNLITSGDGHDTLRGGDGGDTIYGGAGNDAIYGEKNDDLLHAGNGDDKAYGGSQNDKLWGDAGNDYLSGDAGNDTLIGGAGHDTLVGGDGRDSFAFDVAPTAENSDIITSYDAAADTIKLASAAFAALGKVGTLTAGAFAQADAVGQADDRIIYDKNTGNVYYDSNGGDHSDMSLIVTLLNHPDITAGDFSIY